MLVLFVKMGFSKITMKISLRQIMVLTGAVIQITHTRRYLNDSQNYLNHMKIQEALHLAPGREEVQLVWISFLQKSLKITFSNACFFNC